MRYLGGKNRIRKKICEVLKQLRVKKQPYFEPFVGGGWVLQEMDGARVASDGNPALVYMYKALQSGWLPPKVVTEEDYARISSIRNIQDPLTAFVGIGCSYAGKWFGGYARSAGRNYASNASNSLLRQLPKIRDVNFILGEYKDHSPKGCLVYCDPPYEGTTGYTGVGQFNYDHFFDTMREWSQHNTVVISGYKAPKDFSCISIFPTSLDMHTIDAAAKERVEKLFTYL